MITLLETVDPANGILQTCITSLALRNLIRPFDQGILNNACPMSVILDELASSLAELRTLKESVDFDMAPS